MRNGRTTRFWRMLGNRNQEWKTWIEEYSNMTSSRKEKSTSIDTGSREQTTTNGERGTRLFLENNEITATTIKEVEEELGRWKITIMEGEDQLRWGKKDEGEFNLKEVWHYMAEPDQDDLAQHWDKL
jgi:hypothetical protein